LETNQLYDRIVNLYKQYLNNVNFIERKKKDFADKRKEIAQMLVDSEGDDALEKVSFELFIEDNIHVNDVNLIFNKLYTLVEAYSELDNAILLPKEITETCTKYADIVMKTIYVVNDSLISEERVKVSLEKIKENLAKTGEIKSMVEQLKKLIGIS
jgi:triacylglycerol esterase/lipase EstA (alpha/beta hydrolase family)